MLLMRRIRIEEAALAQGLGDSYRTYCAATACLIPYIY